MPHLSGPFTLGSIPFNCCNSKDALSDGTLTIKHHGLFLKGGDPQAAALEYAGETRIWRFFVLNAGEDFIRGVEDRMNGRKVEGTTCNGFVF